MLDLKIECLRIELHDVAGHEHRVGCIVQRAAALLTEQLQLRYGNGVYPARSEQRLKAPPISFDLNRISDESAARAVADAWLDALALSFR